MGKCLLFGAALLVNLGGTLFSASAYDKGDYRKGEFIHVWPQHGVWRLALLAGGQSGVDNCIIETTANAQTLTFFLVFTLDGGGFSNGKTLNFSDGGEMTVRFGDINFLAANNENYRSGNLSDNSDVTMSVDGWQFFERHVIRQIVTRNGLKLAVTPNDLITAWDMPNADDASQISTLDILNRMRRGKELIIRSWLTARRIPLTGFDAVLDEFSECTDMQQSAAQ